MASKMDEFEKSPLTEKGRQLSHPFLRWVVIIGTMIVNLPIAVPSYYGNLSAYTDSYFRFAVAKSASENQTVWMFPIFICFSVVGFLIADWLVKKIGLFPSQISAMVLLDIGIFLTYFTVQHSVALVMFSLMICGGCFVGMIFVINLIYTVKMQPYRPGIASAISSSSFGLGGILINFLITSYLNPSNLAPNVRGINQIYFSQTGILHYVPSSFLLLGGTNLAIQFVGLCLMHIPLQFIDAHDTTSPKPTSSNDHDVKTSNSFDRVSPEGGTHGQFQRGSLDLTNNSARSSDKTLVAAIDPCTGSEKSNLSMKDETADLKPQDILRGKSFYVVWIAICVLSCGYILSLSYYKLFGQLWIKDDVFLTTTGSIATVSTVASRIVLGAFIDRVGVKRSIILVLSLNSITMSFWYLTARPSRWLYFIFIQVICGTTGTLYILAPMVALKLYGKTYFGINYGLLMTSSLITSLMTPILIPLILDNAGWFGLMISESAFSFVALALSVFILLDE